MPNTAIIYTDGACSGNPGPGGWGSILLIDGQEIPLSGGEPNTTNNRMELTGVIRALQKLGNEPYYVTLHSDSKYVTDAINKGWLKSWKANGWTRNGEELKNAELWQQIDKLLLKHQVDFRWVKGHNGNLYNEKCDKLATTKAKEYETVCAMDTEENEREYIFAQSSLPGWGCHQTMTDAEKRRPSAVSEADETRIRSAVMAEFLPALDASLLLYHNAAYGLDYPCGAFPYCKRCNADVEHSCALAYLAERNNPESKSIASLPLSASKVR